MKRYKVVKDLDCDHEQVQFFHRINIGRSVSFQFNLINKLCAVIISSVVLAFSISVFANEDIVCVGPNSGDVGEAGTEGGTNPCNLQASVAERDVPVETHLTNLIEDVSAGEDDASESQDDDSGSVQ